MQLQRIQISNFRNLQGRQRNPGADCPEIDRRGDWVETRRLDQGPAGDVIWDRLDLGKQVHQRELQGVVQPNLIDIRIDPLKLARHLAWVEQTELSVRRRI